MKEINSLYYLYVGNAYPHKNLERVIVTISHLNKKLQMKVQFIIVTARNDFAKKLEKCIEKNDAKDIVKVLGFVDDDKLKILYKNSVGFIFPSLMEGFGIPGLEAMKAGTILLTSDIPVFREIYGNHAIYFNPTSLVSMENAIKRSLALTKVEGAKIIKENKEFVKRYSWEKMAKETLEVYESVS